MAITTTDLVRLVVGDRVPPSVVRADGRVGPAVPLGRRVELPGRGTTFVRELAGPAGAPTLVLLHGFMASGGLNWFRTFEALGHEFHVVAPDLRGHARGLRSRRHVRLADCADDVAALIDTLGSGPVLAAGYSMGGPVAQLLWHRHPEKVAGLVLCATAPQFDVGARPLSDAYLATLAALARATGQLAAVPAAGANLLRRVRAHRPAGFLEWASDEMRRHDVRMLTEAARQHRALRRTRLDRRHRRSHHGAAHEPRPSRGPGGANRARDTDPARPGGRPRGRALRLCPRCVRSADARRVPRRRVARERLTTPTLPPRPRRPDVRR